MSEVITKPPKIKEVSKLPTCSLCAEQATVMTENGVYLCGIPGNHQGYDNDAMIQLNVVSAE